MKSNFNKSKRWIPKNNRIRELEFERGVDRLTDPIKEKKIDIDLIKKLQEKQKEVIDNKKGEH